MKAGLKTNLSALFSILQRIQCLHTHAAEWRHYFHLGEIWEDLLTQKLPLLIVPETLLLPAFTHAYTHASQRKSFICIPHDYSQVSNDKQQRPACHSSSQLGRPADVRLPHACRLCRRWASFSLMSLLFASQDCTSSPVSPGRVQVIVMGIHSYFSSLTGSGFICIWKAASLCGVKHNETCE